MVAFVNPVDGPRIVPFGESRLPTDKLPNGNLGFRVTQRFDDVNLAISAKPHGALDVGNYVCGDRVLAAAPGTARRVGPDANGALAVIVAHADYWQTEYWHLAAFTITNGQTVAAGQQIGVVGDTGLGRVCHLHFVAKHKGVLQDPWPLLKQNQAEDAVTTITQDAIPSTYWQAKGGALIGYKVGAPPLSRTFAAGSQASTNAIVSKVDPLPAGWPAGPYLQVISGGLAGYLIQQSAVTFTAPDPCKACKDELAQVKAAAAGDKGKLATIHNISA